MRLKDLKIGDVVLVKAPQRLARIVSEGEVNIKTAEGLQPRKCLNIEAALITKPIEGYVTKEETDLFKEAARAAKLIKADKWNEIWAERSVHPLKRHNKAKAMVRDEKTWEIQLYCHSETGRPPQVMRSSGCANQPIGGLVLKPELVPEGIFDASTKKKNVEGTKQVSNQKRPNKVEPVTA